MARTLQIAIPLAALAVMVGCVSNRPVVVHLDADTYSASYLGHHRSGPDAALTRAELQAEAFCSARHLTIEDVHRQTAQTSSGSWQAEVQFHCIQPASVVSAQPLAAAGTQAGPLLTLFNEPAETITAVADRSGLVHVFAETTVGMSLLRLNSSPRRAIHHFTVALDGSVQHEVVEPSNRDVWGNLTAVFDADGRLHLIFGRRNIVFGSDGWRSAPDSPRCTLLALSGPQLACVSSTFGTDKDQPFSCEAPIIYKCPSEWPPNVFIGRELTDGSWSGSVLRRDNSVRAVALALSGTEGHDLKLVYSIYTKASLAGSEIRMWSDAPASDLSRVERSTSNDAEIGSTALATSSYSFSLVGDQCAAIDAKSGNVLVIAPWGSTDARWGVMQAVLVVPGESKPRAPIPVPENIFCVAPGNLASAGGGRWHAVFFDRRRHDQGAGTIPLEYRDLRDDTWSAPLELGEWSLYPAGLPHTRTIWATTPVITDNGSGQALVVWNSGSKTLVARWVRSEASPDATR